MCDCPHNALVGQTAMTLVSANETRSGLLVRNLSDNTIFLAFDNPAEINKGVALFPKESFSMERNDFSVAYISAISNADNSLVCFQEWDKGERVFNF
jgi:hypothetical protein